MATLSQPVTSQPMTGGTMTADPRAAWDDYLRQLRIKSGIITDSTYRMRDNAIARGEYPPDYTPPAPSSSSSGEPVAQQPKSEQPQPKKGPIFYEPAMATSIPSAGNYGAVFGAGSGFNSGGVGMTSSGMQYGSTLPAGSTISKGQNPNNPGSGFNASALLGQANSDYQNRLKQYQALISSIMGRGGFLSNLGRSGRQRIAETTAQESGKAEQDLISRGLGNSTIRGTTMAGINRNAELSRQNLEEQVSTQKAGTAMQLFGMNPTPGADTYMNLLMRLGAAQG